MPQLPFICRASWKHSLEFWVRWKRRAKRGFEIPAVSPGSAAVAERVQSTPTGKLGSVMPPVEVSLSSPLIFLCAGRQHPTAQHPRLEGRPRGLGLGRPAEGLVRTVHIWSLVQLSLGREEGPVYVFCLGTSPI